VQEQAKSTQEAGTVQACVNSVKKYTGLFVETKKNSKQPKNWKKNPTE